MKSALFATSIVLYALALAPSVAGRDEPGFHELMRDAGDTMLRILPSVYEAHPDRILLVENLVRLDYLFNQAESHFGHEQVGARISYDLIQERLRDAIKLGERRNINLLKGVVKDTFAMCSTCHTQDKRIKRAFGISKIRELDEYLAAEFSFLTRDYESALTSFNNYFRGDHRTDVRDREASERLLVITAEVFGDPALGARTLKQLYPSLPGRSASGARIRDWAHVLERMSNDRGGLQSPTDQPDFAHLERFLISEWPVIRATLEWHEQEAYWIVIRGELNRNLTTGAKGNTVPGLLYWLGVSDRALHYRFYNSLSRGYLEHCIEGYPGNPYAKACLDEYEMLVVVSFSGSGGTEVPLEVRKRVEELRRQVHGN
jgi:hypothetical protein